MPAKLNFFKTPPSVRLVSSRTVSTSTGISGCFQPHRQTAMPGQKSIYETFLELPFLKGGLSAGKEYYMVLCRVNGMPQKDTLDKAACTCLLVSYRRLSAQFQFSLSAATLGYLSDRLHRHKAGVTQTHIEPKLETPAVRQRRRKGKIKVPKVRMTRSCFQRSGLILFPKVVYIPLVRCFVFLTLKFISNRSQGR
jgi:hypothetical protein